MHNVIDQQLRETVERHVHRVVDPARIDNIIITERFDDDDDMVVDVIIVLRGEARVLGFSKIVRDLWSELAGSDRGFPILSFRTRDENNQIFAAA